MCGIAGYYGARRIDEDRADECLALMGRRGPDAKGSYQHTLSNNRHLLLLHTRLAIIDLDERADQPMQRAGRVMIFNGELYNYLEIRQDLEKDGLTFSTQSDTEVMLHLACRGAEGFDRAEGMWAMALFNESNGNLFLCRDRFGEKPLFIYRDADGVYFGSEPKFIFSLLGRRLPINLDQVRRFLVNGYRSLYKTGKTFFQGLSELSPGTMMTITPDGRTDHRRYYDVQYRPDEAMSQDTAVKGARDSIFQAVGLRLRSDVPLAFLMSGGVDSNTLISIAKRVHDYDVHGFTILNVDRQYDERDLVDQAVQELSIRHSYIPLNSSDFLPDLRELTRCHDSPVYTVTYYVHWRLMAEIARQGYKIALSGTGADELFTGYYDHHLMYLAEMRGNRDWHDKALNNWTAHIRPTIVNPQFKDADAFVNQPGLRDYLYPLANRRAAFLTAPFDEKFNEKTFCPSILRNRMLNELLYESVPVILHQDDCNAMYWSVENRSPFLDRSLVDFCNRIPTHHLIHNGFSKAILRWAVAGIVPEAVLQSRRKVGFNADLKALLDLNEPEVKDELLAPGPVFEIVKKDGISDLIQNGNWPNEMEGFLFNFISAKMFLEEHS
jgi:asparagine synthase (glutamine-hydrolysing)